MPGFGEAAPEEDEMIDETYPASTSAGSMSFGTTDHASHDAADAILSCIAVTMVAIGAAGAIIGLVQSAPRRRTRRHWRLPGDRYGLTPPHGDKLHPNH